jgi:hypothetical protein
MLIKPRQLLKLNLKFYLDQVFIRDGNYQNITLGLNAYDNTDLSQLAPVDNASDLARLGFTTTTGAGRVWQSPFRNWIYQSGLIHSYDRGEPQKTAPTLCSGVYIDGVFKPDRPLMPWGASPGWDPTVYPTIDWINGRVIFSSGVATTAIVRAEYSYGEILVKIGNRHNANIEEYLANTKYGTNPDFYGGVHFPSGRFQPLPAVFIQVGTQVHEAYEVGNRSLVEMDSVTLHCYARSSTTVDNMLDTIRLQDQRGFPIVDFNVAPIPLSGYLSTRSPNYVRYAVLQSNPVVNVDGYSALYADGRFENARVTSDSFEDVEYGRVDIDVRTHLIVPDGPVGTDSIGYNYWQ